MDLPCRVKLTTHIQAWILILFWLEPSQSDRSGILRSWWRGLPIAPKPDQHSCKARISRLQRNFNISSACALLVWATLKPVDQVFQQVDQTLKGLVLPLQVRNLGREKPLTFRPLIAPVQRFLWWYSLLWASSRRVSLKTDSTLLLNSRRRKISLFVMSSAIWHGIVWQIRDEFRARHPM